MRRSLRLPRHFDIMPSGDVILKGIECLQLDARVPFYVVAGGNEPVFRLELMFRAGKLSERQRHASAAMAAVITEGTQRLAARALAEELEYYGASVRCYTTPDTLTFSVHAMTRFSAPVLEIVREMLLEPAYAEEELRIYQKKKIQRYRLSQMQNEYLANRIFSEHMFGATHPYGYASTPEDVMGLTPESLQAHHYLLGRSCLDIFLAGDVREDLITRVRALIHDLPEGREAGTHLQEPIQTRGKWHHAGPQPHQASVRIGNTIMPKGHAEYPGLFFLNTVLGGYHGSRLVRNLREAKGLTYSIQSSMESLLHASCFVVSTDANSESKRVVVREIYKEIDKLRRHQIESAELEMVQNYVCGNFLMQIDGPLNVVDTIKPLVLHNLPLSYFEEFLSGIKSVSADGLQLLAEKYLRPETMTEVLIG